MSLQRRVLTRQGCFWRNLQSGLKGRTVGATQEARFISYCRLLPPREIAKLFETNGMVGRGGGDRIHEPCGVGRMGKRENFTVYKIDYSAVVEKPEIAWK